MQKKEESIQIPSYIRDHTDLNLSEIRQVLPKNNRTLNEIANLSKSIKKINTITEFIEDKGLAPIDVPDYLTRLDII